MNKSILKVSLLSTVAFLLAGCGQSNPGRSDTPKLDSEISLTKVDDEFETHTDIQKQYFASQDYWTLPNSANGKNENSRPNKITFNFEISAVDEVESAVLNISENKNMSDPISYDVKDDNGFKTSIQVGNLKINTQYYYQIVLSGYGKLNVSSVETFKTLGNGPRFIEIDKVSNVRDIGGATTEDGKTVKQGLIYRGAEWNAQNYGTSKSKLSYSEDNPYGNLLSDASIATIRNELKIKTEIDVRGYEHYEYIDSTSQYYLNSSPTEIGKLTDGQGILEDINYVLNPIHTNHDKIYKTDGGKAAVKRFFTTLANENNYPVYFHCAQGKDRTGFIAYVLEGFLGLSKEHMCRDFIISNFSTVGTVSLDYFTNKQDPSKEGSRYDYGAYFDGYEVENMQQLDKNATMQERMTEYLLSCGLTQDQLDKILEINIEQ